MKKVLFFLFLSTQAKADTSCWQYLSSYQLSNDLINVVSTEPVGKGSGTPFFVILDDNSKWVFKADSMAPHQNSPVKASLAEVATFKLSELLNINMVPETIIATVMIYGRPEIGSLQRFVNAKDAETRAFRLKPKSRDISLMNIFDFLVSNFDRHKGNYLISTFGNITLIDNALSLKQFYTPVDLGINLTQESLRFLRLPSNLNLLNTLKNLDYTTLSQEIPELSDLQI